VQSRHNNKLCIDAFGVGAHDHVGEQGVLQQNSQHRALGRQRAHAQRPGRAAALGVHVKQQALVVGFHKRGGEVDGCGGAERADSAFLGENALYSTRNGPRRRPERGKQRACQQERHRKDLDVYQRANQVSSEAGDHDTPC